MNIDYNNSPIPSLYALGYRIIKSKLEKQKTIVIYFAKPEDAIEKYGDSEIYEMCLKRLEEVNRRREKINTKISNFRKYKIIDAIAGLLSKIYQLFLRLIGKKK